MLATPPPPLLPPPLAVAHVIVAVGLDGGEGGICDRPVTPLMAMATPASSISAIQAEISALGFVMNGLGISLPSLTQPFALHLQSGTGFTVSMIAQLDWSSSDSDSGAFSVMTLFSLFDAGSETPWMSAYSTRSSSEIVWFCYGGSGGQNECSIRQISSFSSRLVLTFRYSAASASLEIWKDALLASNLSVRTESLVGHLQ